MRHRGTGMASVDSAAGKLMRKNCRIIERQCHDVDVAGSRMSGKAVIRRRERCQDEVKIRLDGVHALASE
jgi:hypothetical protein